MSSKNTYMLGTIAGIFLVCVFLTAQFSWRGTDRKGYTHVIESDGRGYYLYLPAIFINRTLASQPADERFVFKTEHGAVNKYFAGTAVAMLPFFAGGYVSALIAHKPLNGYSPPFQRAISIAGWFYLCLGLFFLAQLLLLYRFTIYVACITLVAIVFGTNLLMYAVYHPSFSHVYSFCFIAMFLYFFKRFFLSGEQRSFLLAAVALGMIVIIRPTNSMIILVIPFLAGDAGTLKASFKNIPGIKALYFFLILFSIIAVQLVLWRIQTGRYFVQSYRNEGFYFSHPEILNVLFSFRKGFFIYTPLALLALCGIAVIAKKNKFQAYSLFLFLIILIYVTSSWWNWYYGPSFGQRPFIEFYPVFALLLAFLVSSVALKRNRNIMYGGIALLMLFNLLQSFQYVKNIISPWDMNPEKYRYTFLHTAPVYYGCLGGCRDIVPYPGIKTLLRDVRNDYEKQYPGWTKSKTISVGAERKMVAEFKGIEFNSACDVHADSLMQSYRLLYAEISLERNEPVPSGKSGPLVGIVIRDAQNKIYHYSTFAINEIPNKIPNRWKAFNYSVEIPKIRAKGDVIRFYIWNRDKQDFLLDNFHVLLYGIN